MMIALKKGLQNLLLAAISLSLALVALEVLCRIVAEPVDFLRPRLIDDPVLGHVIEPGSGGHDAWGFRNRSVPASADIVTIGDSQTYGVSATARDAWPSVLAQLSGQNVYNLALGGYGPLQYLHLLTTKAVTLNPGLVIVGFYFGNDLLDAYSMGHDNPHLAALKKSQLEPDNAAARATSADAAETPLPWLADLRSWLAQRSVVYNMLIHSAIGEAARSAEAVLVETGEDAVRYDRNGIAAGFTPARRLKALNLEDPQVREGLEIALDVFARMKTFCVEHALGFLVVLIPTKEGVYAQYVKNDPDLGTMPAIQALLANERRVRARVTSFFEEHGIAHVDPLPELQQRVAALPLYPGNFDGHPNRNGYRIIAETVDRYLEQLAPHAAASPGSPGVLE